MDTTARLRELSARVQGSLHDKPALWTGIATSAGFALGIAGRLDHYGGDGWQSSDERRNLDVC